MQNEWIRIQGPDTLPKIRKYCWLYCPTWSHDAVFLGYMFADGEFYDLDILSGLRGHKPTHYTYVGTPPNPPQS